MSALGPLLAGTLDALVPPRCAGCGAAGSWLCLECRTACEPLHGGAGGLPIAAAAAYEGGVRRAIHSFKYRGERGLASELGSLVAARVAADLARGIAIDALVAVPLRRERARARGYDQTALLAADVALRCGLTRLAALHRIRHARPQVELDRDERMRNVAGAFVSTAGSLRGLRVALIDDVTTTGATLREAARAARAAGARSVRAYVIAADE
jgi:ComF family protein